MFEVLATSELIALTARAFVEGVLLLGAFWYLFSRLRLKDKLEPLGRRASRLFLAFLLVWGTVQMIDRWQYFYPQPVSFYPVVRFAMYQIGESAESVDTYRFVGVHSDGSREEINLTEHFTSIGLPALHTRLRTLTENLQSSDSTEVLLARTELRGFLTGYQALLESRGEHPPEFVQLRIDSYRVEDQKLLNEQIIATFDIRAAS